MPINRRLVALNNLRQIRRQNFMRQIALPPEWLPEGAVAYADFTSGNYAADGASAGLLDVFQSGSFDTNYIVPGVGLTNDSPDTPSPRLTGSALATALAGTIVVTADLTTPDWAGRQAFIVDYFTNPGFETDLKARVSAAEFDGYITDSYDAYADLPQL